MINDKSFCKAWVIYQQSNIFLKQVFWEFRTSVIQSFFFYSIIWGISKSPANRNKNKKNRRYLSSASVISILCDLNKFSYKKKRELEVESNFERDVEALCKKDCVAFIPVFLSV